jgi:5-methylcytosine-specific restriction protein A
MAEQSEAYRARRRVVAAAYRAQRQPPSPGTPLEDPPPPGPPSAHPPAYRPLPTPVPTPVPTPAPGTPPPAPPPARVPVRWPEGPRDRKAELPPDWPALRRAVLARDGSVCTWRTRGVRCLMRATVVDHVGDRHDHRIGNLRSLCAEHNQIRTVQQGVDAARRARRRPMPEHPFHRLGARGTGRD